MTSNHNETQDSPPDDVTSFVRQALLDYPLSALLQVGSTARGYSSADSDYDYMAFYSSPELFRSSSVHNTVAGHRVTIEHHNLDVFFEKSADFRFNLASLRQLQKIRDGREVRAPDPNFANLRRLAKSAHLDRRVLLRVCAEIEAVFPTVSEWNPDLQQQQLILWAELLSTLDLTSRSAVEAYSKPKWLYHALSGSNMTEAIAILNELYQPSFQTAREALDQIMLTSRRLDMTKLTETDQRLLQTALFDSQVMAQEYPLLAFPQLRFTADRMLFFIYGSRAVDFLRRDEPIPEPRLFLPLQIQRKADTSASRSRFRSFLTSVNARMIAEFPRVHPGGMHPGSPGSDNLSAHLLHSYSASCLEYSSRWYIDQWLNTLTTTPSFNIARKSS